MIGTEVSIPVGKGKVIIHSSLQGIASSGNYIIIEARSQPGPCNDMDCQPIFYPAVRFSQVPDDSHRLFVGEGYMLALDQAVFNAIDKNRETVTVKRGITGKTSVQGLYF